MPEHRRPAKNMNFSNTVVLLCLSFSLVLPWKPLQSTAYTAAQGQLRIHVQRSGGIFLASNRGKSMLPHCYWMERASTCRLQPPCHCPCRLSRALSILCRRQSVARSGRRQRSGKDAKHMLTLRFSIPRCQMSSIRTSFVGR